MESLLFVGICIGAAALALIANYIAVSRQERSDTLLNPFKVSQSQVNMDVLRDPDIAQYMRVGRKIEAIKRYRMLTNVGLKEAKDAIEAYFEHSNVLLTDDAAPKQAPSDDISDAGLRRLIDQGRIEEAVEAYRLFTGVDVYTARDAVERLNKEMRGDL